MVKTVEAIYKKGVLKPIKKLILPEHTKVRLIVSIEKEWQSELRYLLKSIHKRTEHFSSEEIERDITLATK